MTSPRFLGVALECAARGWYVFPCKPKTKVPQLYGAFHNATTDPQQITQWWNQFPDANVAIAPGKSGLIVFDCDHGNVTEADFRAWAKAEGLTPTLTIRTGRRNNSETGEPEFGTQMYYSAEGVTRTTNPWVQGTHGGEVRCETGHVMVAGCIHPDSGEKYEVLIDAPIAPCPDVVRNKRAYKLPVKAGPMEKIPEGGGRHAQLISVAGKLRASGLDKDAIMEALIPINVAMCAVPVGDADLEHIAASAARYEVHEPEPTITLGGKKLGASSEPAAPLDWRAKYHALDDLLNVTPGKFLVDGILFESSITALAGYAGDRKSIVSLNLAAACVTGEPFMGRFAVVNKPERVLYLCPEMGLRELSKRAKDLGMIPHINKSLFFRSLDMDGRMRLPDLTRDELRGSLVILDTAVRFIEGSESDPQDMAAFADELFRLRHDGATVWVLFHSSKASAGQELTLQNALRGSSELAAMLSMCWATRKNDPKDHWGSISTMYPMKVREFEALSFEFACDRETAACTIVGDPATSSELQSRKVAQRDTSARTLMEKLLASDPAIGVTKLRKALTAAKCGKKQDWVSTIKAEILGSGVRCSG
ncbi:MAG: bifunctional DNA primase/polymerase [Bryobacteraceae bacterium]